ncbi:CCRG-2 family RiPP [Prochlorococcus sp. MIT 1201]|uniref:CCRG-2 family RiPP n=1 Tax=Prochlorococcus sp. MIT 1201 TaxID=3082535 RepID=UPI0039A5205F
MIRINDVVEELVEDVLVRGRFPSQKFKPMTNNELTIEELHSINGGGVFAKLDGFSSRISRSNQRRVIIHPDYIIDPIHKVGIDEVSGPLPDPM